VATTARPILREIEARLDQLRPSERKVADLVLAQPDAVIQLRIVDLAAAAEVNSHLNKLNRVLQSLRTPD
jgi:RpiR family carbohydrate utilization transcriptional regulator